MADRYWVGGAGTWDSATITNWSATSGGGGGASAPTSADNVIFDSASNATAYTVTMGTGAVCADMTMAGPASGNVTWAGSTALSIFGSMLLSATGITRTYTGAITFAATATGKTVTTNGVSLGGSAVTFNGIGGGWTLGSAVTTGVATLTNGTLGLSTFTFTCTTFSSSNANIRTVAFGTGNFTVTGNNAVIWTTSTGTNLTFTGTPVVNFTYSGGTGTRTIQTTSTSPATAISVNVTAGTDIVSFSLTDSSFNDVNFTGFSGSLSLGPAVKVYGNLTLSTGMTVTPGTSILIFAATSGTKIITTNGRTLDLPINFGSPDFPTTATWQFADAMTVGSTRLVQLLFGTLATSLYNFTVGTFNSSGVGVRTINFGSGTWTITAAGNAWNCGTSTNLTTTPGTATINMTAATAKTFAGGGKSYPKLNQGGAGALTITGANTFADMTATTAPSTITFPASTTTTVTAFSVFGTPGNLVTLNSSTSGTRATLSDSSGAVNGSYLSIKDISATGGATWNAVNSVDSGNNLGWVFLSMSPDVSLRSFTERGRD